MRKFETGGTRDTDNGKFDYEAFLSPLVIQEYARYMHKHRVQSDGSLRDGDNWQKLFGSDHYSVCMKSLWRHFMDVWLYHRGLAPRETIDEALCGVLFNTMAYYFKILQDRKVVLKNLSQNLAGGSGTLKASDAGPPMTVPNPERPETLPEFVTQYCRARIKDVETDDGLSPETKHMLKMKYLRILNDAADILNKMKVGQKKDFDLASKMQELAVKIDAVDNATKAAQTASLRTKRRYPRRR